VQFLQLRKLLELDLRSGQGHTGAHISSRSTHTPNYIEIGKLCGRTDTPEFQFTRSLPNKTKIPSDICDSMTLDVISRVRLTDL